MRLTDSLAPGRRGGADRVFRVAIGGILFGVTSLLACGGIGSDAARPMADNDAGHPNDASNDARDVAMLPCTDGERVCDGLTALQCQSGGWSVRRECQSASEPNAPETQCSDGRCGFATVDVPGGPCGQATYTYTGKPDCQWALPPLMPTADLKVDTKNGGLSFEDPAWAEPIAIFHVRDETECFDRDGWYFDSQTAPTTLILCPHTCAEPPSWTVTIDVQCDIPV